MNIKSLLLGSAAALAAACYLPAPAAMASPGGGGSPSIGIDGTILGPQLAELPEGGLLIEPGDTTGMKKPVLVQHGGPKAGPQLAEGAGRLGKHPIFPWQSAEGDGGMKKPIIPGPQLAQKPIPPSYDRIGWGPQLALADKPGLVTITADPIETTVSPQLALADIPWPRKTTTI